jgi:hypothetical protein
MRHSHRSGVRQRRSLEPLPHYADIVRLRKTHGRSCRENRCGLPTRFMPPKTKEQEDSTTILTEIGRLVTSTEDPAIVLAMLDMFRLGQRFAKITEKKEGN